MLNKLTFMIAEAVPVSLILKKILSCVKLRAIRKMKTIVMKIQRKMMMKGLLVKVFIIIIHYIISFCHYLSFVDAIVTLHKTQAVVILIKLQFNFRRVERHI